MRPVLGIGGPLPTMAQVEFTPGSVLVTYTDGLVEQRRDLEHGAQLLSDSVRSTHGRTAREISNAIAATILVNAPDDIAYAVICRV